MCALLQMAQLFGRSVGVRHCRALFDLDESQILLPPFLGGWGDGVTMRSHSFLSSPLVLLPPDSRGAGGVRSQGDRIIIQRRFPRTLKPACIGFPGTIEFFAAAGVDGELVVFKFQQVVLEGITRNPLADGCAKGSSTNYIKLASTCAEVIGVEAGFGFVDVSVKGKAEVCFC